MEWQWRRCTSLPHIKQLHAHLLIAGHLLSVPAAAKLLELCAASAHIPHATRLFQTLPHAPSTNHWNAFVRGLARGPSPADAIRCLRTMARARQRPDALTCSFALTACARALAVLEARQVHARVARLGLGLDRLLATTLLDAYAKVGELDSACKVFDEMPERDVAAVNAMIAGLAQGNL